MQCEHLIDDLGPPNDSLAGSYCIPKGSELEPIQLNSGECSSLSTDCGAAHPY